MKSPMVEIQPFIENKAGYTDMKVLRSAAGWYVGTMYWNPDHGGFWEPGSRDSGYFPTEEAAGAELRLIEAGKAATRLHP